MQTSSNRFAILLASVLVCGLTHLPAVAVAGDAVASVAIKDSDYRTDRAAFRTMLTRSGPSPQRGAAPQVPAGVTEIEFPSGDLHLKAWVGMPDTKADHMPVVIFLHGGFAFGADDFTMAAAYRKAGFVLVTPILRGENGQAGNFSMFYDEVDDVLALADFIRSQPYADPKRIYLAGHSAGATVTLLAAEASPLFDGVAAFSASPDQAQFISHGWAQIAPFDIANTKELELRSPLSYATSLKAPTRLYVGDKEGYRHNTERLAELAKQAKLNVEAKVMPGDHFSYVPAAIEESIVFFKSQQ